MSTTHSPSMRTRFDSNVTHTELMLPVAQEPATRALSGLELVALIDEELRFSRERTSVTQRIAMPLPARETPRPEAPSPRRDTPTVVVRTRSVPELDVFFVLRYVALALAGMAIGGLIGAAAPRWSPALASIVARAHGPLSHQIQEPR
ncbi:MAG: hypothetical protein KF819_01875 [Labilithrix sp.]|nr:hypothetical protein [Labilithrix sp.]